MVDDSGEFVLAIGAERPPFVALWFYFFGRNIYVFIHLVHGLGGRESLSLRLRLSDRRSFHSRFTSVGNLYLSSS